MGSVLRLLTACLLACVMAPWPAQAGGDLGEDPYEIGEKLRAKKHYRTALKYFQLALDRNEVKARYRMGLIHEANGKEQDALAQYQLFIDAAKPDDALRGDAVRRVGAIEERRNKEMARTTELVERGKSLFKKKKYREAKKVLLQAAARDPSRAEAHFYLGEVHLQLGEYGKAKSEYLKAKQYY